MSGSVWDQPVDRGLWDGPITGDGAPVDPDVTVAWIKAKFEALDRAKEPKR